MFTIRNKTSKAYPGQSLLELALVLPFLLFVLFGVLDLGRVFFSSITLVSAAREGARYLSVYPEDISNDSGAFAGTIQTAIREAADSGLLLTSGEVTPSCTNTDDDPDYCDSGDPAIVTVTHDFDLVLGWFLPSPITIERSAQMVVP
jgi:Flp pilus assembly protein TadG